MPPTPVEDAVERPRHRWIVELLLVVVLVHSVALALWLAPSSPVRDAVGEGRLASYVDPYFQQGRDVVGIGTQQVDESFSVRAYVAPDAGGKGAATEWVDVTRDDNRANRHEVAPERAHLIARRLATNLNLAMFNLSEAQRRIVRGLTADDLPSTVRPTLEGAGGRPEAVRFFQAYDQMATQFASLYAEARWGEDGRIVEVQFRAGRRTVPSYADRATTSLDDVAFRDFSFGWRRAFRGSLDARDTFDSYVKK
ncbi:hypothetical protein IFT73_02395 [Aeromicrobium sp. CFBP 8757]|uniref:DUF5819 family protein n=1 Tax=Aeromicrobium sp. CFBP 8757 TaxID=2775288 RepID=UPI001780619D|nr:DUF5819 family protein [Aeromicrobium sp. CFBP 8757]MBD8605693.1 hypothetical protein [Aeromicrobium sp. CFBP 8757]